MLYELLDPEAEAQGIRPYGFQTLHYSTSFLWTLSSAYLWIYVLQILHYSATRVRLQVDCVSSIRSPVNRIRSCADKLGGGWERGKFSERPSAMTMTVTAKMLG